jgi:hypothetical protein
MTVTNADRMMTCAKRMRWFHDNEMDIRKDTFMPYLLAIEVLLKKIERSGELPEELIISLENIIKKAEEACQPEDAHAFVYLKNWKF